MRVYLVTVAAIVIIIIAFRILNSNKRECIIRGNWHIPDYALNKYGLSCFLLLDSNIICGKCKGKCSVKHIYAEDSRGRVVLDSTLHMKSTRAAVVDGEGNKLRTSYNLK